LLEVGVPPAGPRRVAAVEADAPKGGVAAARGASIHHVLLRILLPITAVLHHLFTDFLVLSLGCARTMKSDRGRRGRLGGRIPERSS
jgi:hypothetical protein